MSTVAEIRAQEILDSRGRPTLKARCTLASGAIGSASVPSGASTGVAEAIELRDGDMRRYRGMGCLQAARNVNDEIRSAIVLKEFADQQALDRVLIDLDGTPNKSRLGANAILAVSLAFARAVAQENRQTLYEHLARSVGATLRTLPRLTINLFSGGKHAGGQVAIQDVLIVPHTSTVDESLVVAFAVYQAAVDKIKHKYGMRHLTADEGGLAPPFSSIDEMFEDSIAAIEAAGYVPGKHVSLAIDVASSHFYSSGRYELANQSYSSEEMIGILADWQHRYPIVSIEDGLAENDWQYWPQLCGRLHGKALVLGDDLLCTNPQRVMKAIDLRAANALLLKVNQIGTLSEAAEALQLARRAGWQVTVSARSGETEDNWLADLAVGWQADQIKIGSITQSERLAKYNHLLEIETETKLPLVHWPNK